MGSADQGLETLQNIFNIQDKQNMGILLLTDIENISM